MRIKNKNFIIVLDKHIKLLEINYKDKQKQNKKIRFQFDCVGFIIFFNWFCTYYKNCISFDNIFKVGLKNCIKFDTLGQ